MVTSLCACSDMPPAEWVVPAVRSPGGNPVMALPGLTPRLSLMTDGPVLVTVEPASTANACAVPRIELVWTTDGVGLWGLVAGALQIRRRLPQGRDRKGRRRKTYRATAIYGSH